MLLFHWCDLLTFATAQCRWAQTLLRELHFELLCPACMLATSAVTIVGNDRETCCCSLRFKFIAIIRHVKFSSRSWLGNRVLVLLYSFHICVPKGSLRLISSGLSLSIVESPPAASFHAGKTDSRKSSWLRADASEATVSSLLLADQHWSSQQVPPAAAIRSRTLS